MKRPHRSSFGEKSSSFLNALSSSSPKAAFGVFVLIMSLLTRVGIAASFQTLLPPTSCRRVGASPTKLSSVWALRDQSQQQLPLLPPPLQLIWNQSRRSYSVTTLMAKPKRGAVVDSYRTVSVKCTKCRTLLFRYKKKNGTKSNLIKCYVERIAEDSAGVLEQATEELNSDSLLSTELPHDYAWKCPNCNTQFARSVQIHGLPALKMVGGKVIMTKK